MNTLFKYSLCALAVSSTGFSAASFGQQGTAQTVAPLVERIEVTGSRIKRNDLEGAAPIDVISRDEIAKSGFSNLQQLLERTPVAGTGTFSTRGNNQDSTANGGAAISLRGFGSDATLVLINGRRVAVSAFAENIANSFVDINSIPVAAIERVEILKDGASAVYGSDAVAGVVNIILRKDFDGAELSVSHGGTTGPSYDETSASLVWGTESDDANATLILDYFKNTVITGAEMGRFGTANQAPYGGNDFRSSRGFPGNFIVNGETRIDPDCPTERAFGQTCVFDYGPFGMVVPAAERVGAIFQGSQRLSSDLEGYVELAVQHNRSQAAGAATPLDGDAGLTVPASHPDNPFDEDIAINRFRTVDAGPRTWDIESDSLRLVVGLRGQLNNWDWDIAAQKGRSESMQTGSKQQGWVRTDFLQEQINLGNYNPFGGTINSPEVIDAITTSLVRRGESHITAYDASISGEAFALGDQMVSMAAGLEYREEDAFDQPDDQFQRGLIFGTESVSAQAQRDQYAAYIELLVPVSDELEFTVAGRYDHYSDFGSTTNPQLSMKWRPLDNFTLRASFGQGFRAPSLAQIGLGPSQESVFFTDTFRCPTIDPSNPACAATDYTIVFVGAEGLQPEESETFNLGFVWQINDEFDVTADVWSITQDNKIDKNDFENVYNAECNNQSSTICVRLDPLPGQTLGELSRLFNSYVNVSSQEATGLDLSTSYRLALQDMGQVRFNLDWSYINKFEKNGIDYAGEYNYPQHRWLAAADWSHGDWGVVTSLSYIGEFEDYAAPSEVESTSTRSISAQMLLDVQLRYNLNDKTQLVLGMNNALDEDPPFAIGDGDADLYGYASRVHNPRGQFVYGKVSYRF
ncbi:MAG: TonB-dependent receptor [Rheinheimera sp.]|uniref:TonB-dependent receptor n=1 Tax=Arsukibacterium sp. UBA3155 TaxID=1946058 RepID=UPI000C931A76|nr:TonB-dependent receptor [Arsukibacterium sp. UBA3155]MAD73225.1 TonB-dependent receptor [Rheinheimera sp.]|tara:strand:- start:55266 stop:57851 length:2586 start_codon:yes stop_codon:yes gene_type:complete